ncbi:Calcium-binding allergen Ole e 8 [Vitis vinifera]|uniref:Calcium-binding allergen Ole e 8 n=1 Tax=Vitis vinifera TaxID=29760 RepID=A0A438C2C7_VITVI|nr:Calcium-binding allergen Ole e 8 [Vitis vinifera]
MTSNSISESTKPNIYPQDKDELQKVFNRFDANGDGKISSSELANVLRALGSESSPEEMSRVMKEIDTDDDGCINLEEFAPVLQVGEQRRRRRVA